MQQQQQQQQSTPPPSLSHAAIAPSHHANTSPPSPETLQFLQHEATHRTWLPVATASENGTVSSSAAASTVSIASYNVLAQTLVNRRDNFNFASKISCRWKHRCQHLASEIRAINVDIYCLQEADNEEFWRESFNSMGYDTLFKNKPNKPYGLLIAWKRNRFELLHHRLVKYSKLAQNCRGPAFYELCKSNIALLAALRDLNSSRRIPNRDLGLIVTTTHLYWRPNYMYTRLRQLHMLLEETVLYTAQLKTLFPNTLFSHVTTGDFNLEPTSILYDFLTRRRDFSSEELSAFQLPHDVMNNTNVQEERRLILLEQSSDIADKLQLFDTRTESDKQLRLQHVRAILESASTLPYLRSCYANYMQLDQDPGIAMQSNRVEHQHPICTTYNPEWHGTVDYIFLCDNFGEYSLRPRSLLKLPSMKAITCQTALPNDAFGSDHVALAAELEIQALEQQHQMDQP